MAGGPLPSVETRVGSGGDEARGVEEPRHGEPQGEWSRGCGEGNQLLQQPEQEGPDGLCDLGGGELTHRFGRDGGGVQGSGETAVVWLGDEVEGTGSGGGVECAVLDVHDGALVAVLE